MKTPIAALTATAALAATTGCGESNDRLTSDERAVADVIKSFLVHYAKGEGEAACDLLTPRGREQVRLTFSDCEETIDEFAGEVPNALIEAYGEVEVRRVKIMGDRAIVDEDDVDFPKLLDTDRSRDSGTIIATRTSGEWKFEARD